MIVTLSLTNDKVKSGVAQILEAHPSRTKREEWGTLYMGVRYKNKTGKDRPPVLESTVGVTNAHMERDHRKSLHR